MERYRFGAFDLDLDRALLRHAGEEVPLRRKTFLVLAHLVRNHDRLVSREELRAAAWPDVSVSDTTLATTVHELRSALAALDSGGEPLRTVHGRGYRLAVPVEVVTAPTAAEEAPAAAPERSHMPFVGRAELLAEADEWLDEVAGGLGHTCVLSGPRGIGTSRALYEIGRRAAARGAGVYSVHCLDEPGAPPYWPWSALLRRVAAAWPGAAALAREPRLAPAFGLSSEEATPSDPTQAEEFLLLEAVAGFLREASRARPRVLVLDDLHRADEPSARLLVHLARTLDDASIFLLGGLREWEVGPAHPLAGLLAELPGPGRLVPLAGLQPGETAELVASVAGWLPKLEVVAAFQARSGGQPLFVLELARALVTEGALDDPSAVERVLTPTLRRVVDAQIAPLPSAARSVIAAAAALGDAFEVAALQGACVGVAPEAVRDALAVAARRGLVVASGCARGSFRFAASLVRDVLLDDPGRACRDARSPR